MIPEGRSIFPNLTVTENLLMYTFRRPGSRARWWKSGPSSASPPSAAGASSWRARCRAASNGCSPWPGPSTTDPEILLLDELSMGLAPLIVEELYDIVGQLVASEELTIVMVEQFVQTALSIADRAAIMVNGELVKQGKPAEIRSEVVGAYLGAEAAGGPPTATQS